MTSNNTNALSYELASAICMGARDYQEDTLMTDLSDGAGPGLVILADGMGGHAAGDIASKIVVTEMFNELTFRRSQMTGSYQAMSKALNKAAQSANTRIAQHAEAHPATCGMGATLLCLAIHDGQLHWLSIGDSPLFLFRGNTLHQINEDHSMAPQIDLMVEAGLIPDYVARSHPDRNVLTSVIAGDPLTYIDCPEEPLALMPGDIVIAASDGLQYLSDLEIAELLDAHIDESCHTQSDALMTAISDLADPTQDNVSLALIQVKEARASARMWQTRRDTTPISAEPLLLVDPVKLPKKSPDHPTAEPEKEPSPLVAVSAAE